ncbi:hypothetical protein [Bradyrhizobium sp.]|uniref:hypothetical protein n=1 Tax=Bradyrhizobium sp. TaxID=376 RepID=UPI003C4452D3
MAYALIRPADFDNQNGEALFTCIIAKTYAPELNLIGVAAAALATDLAALLADDIGTNGCPQNSGTIWNVGRLNRAFHKRISLSSVGAFAAGHPGRLRSRL